MAEVGLIARGETGSNIDLASLADFTERSASRNHIQEAEVPLDLHSEAGDTQNIPHLPHFFYLCELRHNAYESTSLLGPSESGLVSKWRTKDRMKTGYVALVLCLNIGVDPPDVIKISPCARMECWIDPSSMPAKKALETIGKSLQAQYERWQPKARYKPQLDPTVEDVKKLCLGCRKSAKSERVLFHYNGHGVPKPTVNGEIWLFNKSFTQYIPLSVYELESWMGTPSIYVFDCSAAGIAMNALCERSDWSLSGSATKDCILLAACGAAEILPQNAGLPADVFTSCLTTPIKMALRWFCSRSLLRDSLDPTMIDKIPGIQNDRKTPLGELNWIFTAITDTIAWNVLPRELFQKLFRQDLLVASLFRNYLLAERIMRVGNCTPQSYPRLPPTHQHSMWQAWDFAAEICLSQLSLLLSDPNAKFQPSPFFTEQLTAFEVWLEHGSEKKQPPEQLPIVLQVLLSQSHRSRALVLLGRFLDMGAWAVDLALSVGIFPYVLKLLQTTAAELRQILVFIWTKILALDKSCQVDLVKDNGHLYFIRFLDSPDIYSEQRAMAAFVLSVIVDGHRRGQEACAKAGLVSICLKHIQFCFNSDHQSEPLLLQWLCLCLGKLWDGYSDAQILGLQERAPAVLAQLLLEPQPEVRASAMYALGTLIDIGSDHVGESCLDEALEEEDIAKSFLEAQLDGSPLVRAELAIGLARLAVIHNPLLRSIAEGYLKPPSNSLLSALPALTSVKGTTGSMSQGTNFRVGSDGTLQSRGDRNPKASAISLPSSDLMRGSPSSDGSSHLSEEAGGLGNVAANNNGAPKLRKSRNDENSIYSQCVSVMYGLGRDPSPQVASLGRQVLRMIGVEAAVVNHPRLVTGSGHQHNTSVGAVPSTPIDGLSRSFSWLDLTSGNFNITFRTPPASPPTSQNLLAGNGMRRVCSLEFSPHLWRSADRGLTGAALVGVGTSLPSDAVPASSLYNWSCGHFARPLLEPLQEDDDKAILRREYREQSTVDGISKCQHSSASKVSDQIASWDTESGNSIHAVLLHPFLPIVCAVDEKEMIRIWNYEKGTLENEYPNHSATDKGVAKVCLINELDNSLLLVASSDGSVRVWKDYTQRNNNRIVTAWQTVQGHWSGARSINAVVDWQQLTGYVYASGDISSIMVWDVNQELLAFKIHTFSDHSVCALSASYVHPQHVISGFGDGSVRIFDIRSRELACTTFPHRQRVVGIDFQPGMDATKIVSASHAGDLQFIDIRNSSIPYQSMDAFKGSLSAMAVHRHAPLIALGSSKQFLKVVNTQGEKLAVIRYHNSFLGQRIGPLTSLHFHPYKVYLAAGASDSIVSLYSGDVTPSR